jgi:hypothetical protein
MSGSTPKPRPYPIEPLAQAIGIHPNTPHLTATLANTLGLNPRSIYDGRTRGLTTRQADRWAALAGLHPGIIWPHWWDDDTDPGPLPNEDDPPIDTLEPISPERLAALRRWPIAC